MLNYLREAHQHQQGEEIGTFERLGQLLNAVVGEDSDDGAPLRAGIQTVQDICHSARPIQTYTAVRCKKQTNKKIQTMSQFSRSKIYLVLPV